MLKRVAPALRAIALLTACTSPRPPGVDNQPPRIGLSLLNGVRSASIDSSEET
ncbi:MAG: hypothetical protein ACREEP_07120 [Dongiaceae bacterium]